MATVRTQLVRCFWRNAKLVFLGNFRLAFPACIVLLSHSFSFSNLLSFSRTDFSLSFSRTDSYHLHGIIVYYKMANVCLICVPYLAISNGSRVRSAHWRCMLISYKPAAVQTAFCMYICIIIIISLVTWAANHDAPLWRSVESSGTRLLVALVESCLVSFPRMYMIVPLRTDSFLQGDHVHLLQHGHNQGDIALKKQLCRTSRTLWAQTYLYARSPILANLSREISISSCIYKLLLIFLLFSTSLHVHITAHSRICVLRNCVPLLDIF